MGQIGDIRRPDFQWKIGTEEQDIFDLKPQGFEWENQQQYKDIRDWSGITPTQLNYHRNK